LTILASDQDNEEGKTFQLSVWRRDMHTTAQPVVTNNLKALRQDRGLALYGLAALAGVSPTTLSAIEQWNYRPTGSVRGRIAAALGVQVTDIWMAEKESRGEPVD
jgi:DNA-binding XRE family transcriptional regulator